MERREFVKTCGLACIGGSALLLLLEGCAGTNYYAQTSSSANLVMIQKKEFTADANGKTILRKFVLVKSEKYDFPICVFALGGDQYSAILMECSHKGCELRTQESTLICPCHGSEFSNTGIVLNPPADQNLRTFSVRTDEETIYIQL